MGEEEDKEDKSRNFSAWPSLVPITIIGGVLDNS